MNNIMCFGEYIPQRQKTIPTYYAKVKIELQELSFEQLARIAEDAEKKLDAIRKDIGNVCVSNRGYLEITSNREIMKKNIRFLPTYTKKLAKERREFWKITQQITKEIIQKYKK